DVGVEVPALPGLEDLAPALPLLDFLNINELEWGEASGDAMRSRGLVPADSLHNAVKNSHRWAAPLRRHQKVHWCSSSFKDSVQLRERLKRIARNTARSFDEVTEDGTIVYGVIEIDSLDPSDLPLFTRIPWERSGGRIEMGWKALKRNSQKLPGNKYIVERYPNGGIIVEVTPL
ncbi:MAG TPA: radical SAM protein, partial [Methanomicrobiales archaeon]|nr:radical SAM protein [Methanomicrobiales archaeon]